MRPGKSAQFYSDAELKKITEQWLRDKARIDSTPAYGYYFDKDQEYERHLHNANLRALFRHAAYLKRGLIDGTVILYPNEEPLVSKVYQGILKNGYYTKSKEEEKRVRAHFGKAVSRQYWKRIKR